jgi:hypothetical protein
MVRELFAPSFSNEPYARSLKPEGAMEEKKGQGRKARSISLGMIAEAN